MPAKLATPAWAIVALVLVGASTAEPVHQLRPTRAFGFPAAGHGAPIVVTAVAVSPDGSRIAASGDDHHIRLWNAASRAQPAVLRGHDDWVRGLCFDGDCLRLASVGDDRRLTIWDVSRGGQVLVNRDATGPLGSVAFLPGGQQLVTASRGDGVRLVNVSSGMIDKSFKCPCEDTRVTAISPDGKWLAAAGRNGKVRVWDLTTGEEGHDYPADTQRIHAIAFSPDSSRLATGGDGPQLRLWDLKSGELAMQMLVRPAKVRSLLFLSDDRLATGGTDNMIHVWDLNTELPTHRLVGHTGTVAALARDAGGELIASGGFDTTVLIWRLPPAAPRDDTASSADGVLR